jgi:hypothetical protein
MAETEDLEAQWARLTVRQREFLIELVKHTEAGVTSFVFIQDRGEVGLRFQGGIRSLLRRGPYPAEDFANLETAGLIEIPQREDNRRVVRSVRVTPDAIKLVAFAQSQERLGRRVDANSTQAISDPPVLFDPAKRMLALQWEALREKHKLTDEEVGGYDRERQRLLGIVAKPPRGVNPSRPKQAAYALGLGPSVRAAEARFLGTDREYWLHWGFSGADYETYAAWLDSLKRDILAEQALLWKGRSTVTDRWFARTCGPAIEKALSVLIKGRVAQAREVEMGRLDRKARAEAWARAADGLPKTNPDGAGEPKADECARTDPSPALNGRDTGGLDRRAAVDAYIEEVRQTGRQIIRTDIWKTARYKTRAEFERWESYWYEKRGRKGNQSAHEKFTRLLKEKPHLK